MLPVIGANAPDKVREGGMPQGGLYDDGVRKFRVNICEEWDCSQEYCFRMANRECHGEFWTENCLFKKEHKEMNYTEMKEEET